MRPNDGPGLSGPVLHAMEAFLYPLAEDASALAFESRNSRKVWLANRSLAERVSFISKRFGLMRP